MKKLFLFIIPFLFFGCVTTGTFEVSSDGKTLLSYGCEDLCSSAAKDNRDITKELEWGKPFDYVTTTPMDLADTKYYDSGDYKAYSATKKYLVSKHQAAVDAKCKKYDEKFLVTRTYLNNGKKIESSFSSKAYVIADKITTIIYIYDTYDEAKAAYKDQLIANPMHIVEFRISNKLRSNRNDNCFLFR